MIRCQCLRLSGTDVILRPNAISARERPPRLIFINFHDKVSGRTVGATSAFDLIPCSLRLRNLLVVAQQREDGGAHSMKIAHRMQAKIIFSVRYPRPHLEPIVLDVTDLWVIVDALGDAELYDDKEWSL